MAIIDKLQLPRGWTRSVSVEGLASLTIPASSGITHVLDSVTAKFTNTSGADAQGDINVTASDGSLNQNIGHFAVETPAAGSLTTDEINLSNLDLATGVGASLTVAFSVAPSSGVESLIIQGHDI